MRLFGNFECLGTKKLGCNPQIFQNFKITNIESAHFRSDQII